MFTLKFLKDWRCFKAGEIIDTGNDPILILVGDQGAGKSSIFELMNNLDKHKDVVQAEYRGHTKTKFFDTERMNPRIQNNMGESKLDFYTRLYGMFSSHGQMLLPIMTAKDLIESATPRALIVDEPESGLSMMSQMKLLEFYRQALAKGHSVTLATHSPILMKLSPRVFDVSQRAFVETEAYIKSIVGDLLPELTKGSTKKKKKSG